MEKWCVVYSMKWVDENITENNHFHMLKHSIESLREHSAIDIVVYTDHYEALRKSLNVPNCKIIEFDPSLYKIEGEDWIWSHFVLHKWPNCFDLLVNRGYDRLLFCDPDVHFFRDPEILFELFKDKDTIYIKSESWNHIDGFNDGTFLLSKPVAEKLISTYLERYKIVRTKMISEYQERDDFNSEIFNQFKWACYQHSSYFLFKEKRVNMMFLSKRHVRKLDEEPGWAWSDEYDDGTLVLVHYFKHHARLFVPSLRHT